MSVVKINTLDVPPQGADEMIKRFSARIDDLSQVEGFLAFELLKPTGGHETSWFVYTRWTTEDAYQAWRASESFARGHAGVKGAGGQPGGGHPGGGHPGGGHPGGSQGSGPANAGPTLLEFEVAASATSQG